MTRMGRPPGDFGIGKERLYQFLLVLNPSHETMWPGNRFLAEKTGFGERQIRRQISDLIKDGRLRREVGFYVRSGRLLSRRYLWLVEQIPLHDEDSRDVAPEVSVRKDTVAPAAGPLS